MREDPPTPYPQELANLYLQNGARHQVCDRPSSRIGYLKKNPTT